MSDLFSTDDLRDRADEILERVRSGREVRLYDPHGFDMTLQPTQVATSQRAVATVSATLLLLLQARGRVPGAEQMSLVDFGDWTWLRHLDSAQLDEFLAELTESTVIACRECDVTGLDQLLERWRENAEAAKTLSAADNAQRARRRPFTSSS